MEPTTLIISALAAGATAALKGTASYAIEEAYSALKGLLTKRLAGNPKAETFLQNFEKKPDAWKESLKDAVTEAAADEDERIIQTAERLLQLSQSSQAAPNKYNVKMSGEVQGQVIGDENRVTMSFRNISETRSDQEMLS